MLKNLILALVAIIGSTTPANAGYSDLEARADRFFSHREWASAGAMYTLMLHERPQIVSTYTHALVSAAMLSDTTSQSELTIQALNANIPVDSIFSGVEKISFSIGQTSLYEKYLHHLAASQKWMTRVIDPYLMRYYAYRRNPEGMVRYAETVLSGLPDDINALYILAQGYLLMGKYSHSIAVYNHIVELDPDAYEALLYLGNYYSNYAPADTMSRTRALLFLNRAYSLHPTPVVASTIDRLNRLSSSSR